MANHGYLDTTPWIPMRADPDEEWQWALIEEHAAEQRAADEAQAALDEVEETTAEYMEGLREGVLAEKLADAFAQEAARVNAERKAA